MHAAVVRTFGQPPRCEEFPEPGAGEGEVIVQVCAAGLHPIVKALASGAHYGSTDTLPLIPGVDARRRRWGPSRASGPSPAAPTFCSSARDWCERWWPWIVRGGSQC
jgi:hypothetical protein